MNLRLCVTLALAVTSVIPSSAQRGDSAPGAAHEHEARSRHEPELNARGRRAMGFDQDKATHHFVLLDAGGLIQVEANDPADRVSRDRIRAHLRQSAREFGRGVFASPIQTHAEVPAGVAVMERLRQSIEYEFESTPRGGRVRITTGDADALHAVHEFLRYQIVEHETGDPLQVLPRP